MKSPLLWSSLALIVLSQLVGVAASDRDPNPGNSARGNRFVNDPCLDPAPVPFNSPRTVQSETEIAVLNAVREDDDNEDDDDADHGDWDRGDGDHDHGRPSGKLMVAGYNDSYGQYDNRQGISGFSYSTNGGKQWIDAGGLPPVGETDAYLGHPVVAVHHRTKKFYYASLYRNVVGGFTISVNRGEFKVAPQQVPVESFANTRCEGNAALYGIPDPPAFIRKRIIWEPPVEAVVPNPGFDEIPGTDDDDALDKEWLYVNQETGALYLTYTRFGADGSTPIELVRSFDGGQTWTPPSVIVPNVMDTFNHGTQPVVTPTGRVIVTWLARQFALPDFVEIEQRIETAFSDDCGTPAPCTFSAPFVVDNVNPQGTPLGDNRSDFTVDNNPYIAVDKGRDDGVITPGERRKPGFGNVYIAYFDGKTPLPAEPVFCEPAEEPCNPFARAANILLSRSVNDGATYKAPVKVNDDPGDTSHVFPNVQVNKHGEVFVSWIDRRVDRPRNLLNDTWGDISNTGGASFGHDGRISTVSTDWIVRQDYTPNFGNYNSSEVVSFNHFLSIWADGRFPPPSPITSPEPPFYRPEEESATPDTLSAIVKRNGTIKR